MDLLKYIDDLKKIETPFYFYDLNLLQSTLDELKAQISSSNFHVHYAMKANVNDPILNLIRESGLGADCVSANEIKKALELGFDNSAIVFAGVGKSDAEINYALDKGIFAFNCESLQEIQVINELAEAKSKKARIALRINPNVNARTHKNITTGLHENKFGINHSELAEVIDKVVPLANIALVGIHFHIGSQITALDSYRELCHKVAAIYQMLVSKGIELTHVNVGGGLGIDYDDPLSNPIPKFKEYFQLFKDHLKLPSQVEIHFELGRSIVGQCGALISKVLYLKEGINTNFLIIDAGMTELMRPALYQAKHHIVSFSGADTLQEYDVVGPVCESTDSFAEKLKLPTSERGDFLGFLSAGAYGEVMANRYNLRDLPKVVYSNDL